MQKIAMTWTLTVCAVTSHGQPAQTCESLASDILEALCRVQEAPQPATELTGSWRVSLSGGRTISLTFHADGTVSGTSPQSAYFGTWRGGRGEFSVRMDGLVFDGSGIPAGRRRMRASIHFAAPSHQQFIAEIEFDRIEPDGTLVRIDSVAAASAERTGRANEANNRKH
jgi:hypothetical protein